MKKKLTRIYISLRKRLGDKREWTLKKKYHKVRGRIPDFENPSDFSEWVMSNILHERNNAFAPFADKVSVKDYVASKDLGHIVPKLLGVWDRAEDVDWDSLPEKFAIKTNQGCGYNLFCRDKSTFDTAEATKKLDKWLHEKYSAIETHYDLIEPKIFAEQFLDDAGNYPIDYRIYCFRGEPFLIDCTICENNDQAAHWPHYMFDTDWNYRPEYSREHHDDPKRIPQPEGFDKMLDYAHTLSADFEFVRVDLYNFDGKIWLGELTFTPAAGVLRQFTDLALRNMYKKLVAREDE